MIGLYDFFVGMRFLLKLPFIFRPQLNEAACRSIVQDRLRNRAAIWLQTVRKFIFPQKQNPYCRLLKNAGVGYLDLKNLLQREGLEGSLKSLFKLGVYVTNDEFKGRREVRRGSFKMQLQPDMLRNPLARLHIPALTSGSGGRPTPVLVDLELIRDCAVDTLLENQDRRSPDWCHALWLMPGGLGIDLSLEYGLIGKPPQHWFSQIDPAGPSTHPRYRHSARALRMGAALAGVRLPYPQYVPVKEPEPIISWLSHVLAQGRNPHIYTMVSSAIGLCLRAQEMGRDLTGALFTVTGEPYTLARQKVIHQSGARALPLYGATEVRTVGPGCLNPVVHDEVHLQTDCHAIIQPGPGFSASDLPPDALMITTVLPTMPFVLINYCLGDKADLVKRECGCPLQSVGWVWHLSSIASYEKMTAGGVAFSDSDLFEVLESTLPRRFGGGPNDYQLVEEECLSGEPRLRLLVNPSLGSLDVDLLRETFLEVIGEKDESHRLMSIALQEAKYLKVERQAPQATASGKVLHIFKKYGQK